MRRSGVLTPKKMPDVSAVVQYFEREVLGSVGTIICKDNSPGNGSTFIVGDDDAFLIRKVDQSDGHLVPDQILSWHPRRTDLRNPFPRPVRWAEPSSDVNYHDLPEGHDGC